MTTAPAPTHPDDNFPGQEDRRARLRQALLHAGHYLPAQAPLEVFVHHNTLHAFQHLPFHEALAQASRKLGARCYLSEETYRTAWREGRITEADLRAAFSLWSAASAAFPEP